jgi:16S rRNA (uracil1498-N3)-methyltransferase
MGVFGAPAEHHPMTPRFLVGPELLSSSHAVLTGAELHHLRVRRLHAGSELILTDGLGHQRAGVVVSLDLRQAVVLFQPQELSLRESPLRLVLAQAVLKGDKMDLVVEKATEIGVSEILVFECERSIGRISPDRHARWLRKARGATKQCHRSIVPAIGRISFDQLLLRTEPLRLLFWEGESAASLATVDGAPPAALAAVGPEGGFCKAEVAQASGRGFHVVGLGPRTLRAETAAVVAVALCQFLWGDLSRRHLGL